MVNQTIGIACHQLQYSGGMERYTLDLINGFTDLGVSVTVFAKKFDSSLPEYQKINPVHLPISWLPGKMQDPLFSWLLTKKRSKEKVTSVITVVGGGASEIAVCGGTHLGFLKAVQKRGTFGDKQRVQYEYRTYHQAKVIIAHSNEMAQELKKEYGIDPQKIRVIYPPVDYTSFSPSSLPKKDLKKALNFPEDKTVFLFPSSSHVRKGYDLLESYFSTSSLPIHLAVIGRPLPRVARNIAYYGYHAQIRPFYQGADVTILPSLYEPFGLVAIESLLCGTPILTSDRVGAQEVILPFSASSLFKSGDLNDLDRVVRHILETPPSFPKEIKDLFSIDFSVENHCRHLIEYAL